jgi:putative ubiquitin-RnfH superfamily antitoxin RatB of RatAB toxin-antitoxin module
MKVHVIYALPKRQFLSNVKLPDGGTVNDAIQSSGILKRFPAIDLEKQKTGIFGKFVKLDAVLQDGDRVEIYRPLTVDPKTVPKRAKRVGEVADSPDA